MKLKSFLLVPFLLLVVSCAMRSQTITPEQVIITNRDTSLYPVNDLIIRNATLDQRIQIGIGIADQGVLSMYDEDGNMTVQLWSTESVAMVDLRGGDDETVRTRLGISSNSGYIEALDPDAGTDTVGTTINGGLVTANRIAIQIPSSSGKTALDLLSSGGGSLRFYDLAGAGNYAAWRGFNGTATTAGYDLHLPGVSPGASACSPNCLMEFDASGNATFIATPSGGSGSSSGTNDEIQITDNAGGFTSLANFRYDAGNTAISFPTNIATGTDSTYLLGTNIARFAYGYFDNTHTEYLLLHRQGQPSHDYSFVPAGSTLYLRDSVGTDVIQWGSSIAFYSRSIDPLTDEAHSLGSTTRYWNDVYGANLTVKTTMTPTAANTVNIGSSSFPFNNLYLDDWTVDNTGIFPAIDGSLSVGSPSFSLASVDADNITLNSSMLPDTNEGASIGLDLLRFDFLYIDDIRVDNDIIPRGDDISILGGPSNEFAHVYTDDITITGTCTGCPSGGTPAGSTTQVQWNNAGAFGASSNFTFDTTFGRVSATRQYSTTATEADNDLLVGDEIQVYGGSISGAMRIKLEAGTGSSGDEITINNSSGSQRVIIGVADSGSNGGALFTGTHDIAIVTGNTGFVPSGIYVNGNHVLGAREAAVTNPTGGSTIDTEARAAIDAILDRLEGHGLIAP